MCFSAEASFGASLIIGTAGVLAIVKSKNLPQKLFASIPIVFSIQQFTEVMLWLTLSNPSLNSWQPVFLHLFLVFAIVFWPVWIPLTIRLLETEPMRKKILNVLLVIGVFISLGIAWILWSYPVKVMSGGHHLHYVLDIPPGIRKMTDAFSLLYCLSTIASPFLSGIKRMKWLGIVFALSYIFTLIFYKGFVVSIWCYFAALLSLVILWILTGIRKKESRMS